MSEITKEDEALMETVKQKWLDMIKTPINKQLVTEGVEFICEYGGLPKPEVIFCNSPAHATETAEKYWDMWVDDERIKRKNPTWEPDFEKDLSFSLYARVSDLGWVSYYDFFEQKGVLDDADFKQYKKIFEGGLFDSIQTELYWFVVPNPKYIRRDDQGRVHADLAPAVEWEDGTGRYYLHGTKVPQKLAMTPSASLSIDMYNSPEIKESADIRTEFVRKFGIDRMVSMGKVVDTFENYDDPWYHKSEYELVDMSCLFDTIEYAPHLKMKHQTMDMFVVEPVSPTVRTIAEALKDRIEEDLTDHVITDIK